MAWRGGVAYFAVFIVLGLAQSYYTSPVDLVAVLYLGNLLFPAWQTMRRRMRFAVVALAVIVVGQAVRTSALNVLERKSITRGKAEIASLILERYRQNPSSMRQLYFPYTEAYVLEEFLAYLNYLGLPVEREPGSPVPGNVAIFSAKQSRTGKCFLWDFICHAGPADRASLVVVLPDDGVPQSDWAAYYEAAQKLGPHDPRVRPPDWLWRALVLLR
jgi:hypothetical protein